MNRILSLAVSILLLISGKSLAQTSVVSDLSFNQADSVPYKLGADNTTRAICIQPDDKILIAGDFTNYNGIAVNGLVRLHPNGELDQSFNAGTGFVGVNFLGYAMSIAVQPDGKILVAGYFETYNGTPVNNIARLNADGTLDNSFNIGTGPDSFIKEIALQADGKIVVIGGFNQFASNTDNHAIVRLNSNGSVDGSFAVGSGFPSSFYPSDIALQQDGGILVVGGTPTVFNSEPVQGVFRLLPDGSLDHSFDIGSGASLQINKVCVQHDGKILVAGYFDSFNGEVYHAMVRLNSDGSTDTTFNVGTGGDISQMAERPNGEIAVIGEFQQFNNVNRMGLVYLDSTGTIVSDYNGFYQSGYYPTCVDFQSNGKLILAGPFGAFHFTSGSSNFNTGSITRFTEAGFIDPEFNKASGFDYSVNSVKIQSDNKIVVGGQFYTYNNKDCGHITRLNPDGTTDSIFNANVGKGAQYPLADLSFSSTDPRINDIHIYADGKILLFGEFTSFNDAPLRGIIRLNPNGTIDNSFISDLNLYEIRSGKVQPDGKIIAVTSSGQVRRLNADGTIDNTLTPFNAPDGILLQPDGKIIAANGTTISRFNADGSADNTFTTGSIPTYVYDSFLSNIKSLLLEADGKIIVSGFFDSYNSTTCPSMVRLNPDGTLATEQFQLDLTGAKSQFTTSALQSDGKVVLFGIISDIGGIWLNNYMLRYNTDGSLYDSTNFENNSVLVYSCAEQSNGDLMVGGDFQFFRSAVRNRLMRLVECSPVFATENVTEQFSYTWPVNGVTYTSSGQFVETIPTAVGCDSVVTLNLTITQLTVNSFVLPSAVDSCTGSVNITAGGIPDFTFDIGNGTTVTSSQSATFDSLCPGIYSLLVTDGNGDTLHTNFVIPTDSTSIFVDPFGNGEIILDSNAIQVENCDIDYASIDTIYIDSYTILTGDSIAINWAVVDMNGTTIVPTIFVLPQGNNYIQIQLYCPFKSINKYFVATVGVVYDGSGVYQLGIDQLQNPLMEIYPNPTNDLVTISFEGQNADLTIYDAQGKLIRNSGIQSGETVSLKDVQTGIYFFELVTEKGSVVKRVMKN